MVKHYPHLMTWTFIDPNAGGYDENGYPIPPAESESFESICRYENFTGGIKQFNNKAGEAVQQKGTIFVKFGQSLPKVGEVVKVSLDQFEGEVLNVYKGQLNSTIAV